MEKIEEALKFVGVIIFGVAVVAFFIMVFWNMLAPDICGFERINYFQAVGIWVFSKFFTTKIEIK